MRVNLYEGLYTDIGQKLYFSQKYKYLGLLPIDGINMPIVSVDGRGRITFPKETGVRGGKAVIVSAGSFYNVIPIPGDPKKYAEGWLDSDKSRKELKKLAEERAREDARRRAERRKQL